MKIGLYCIRFMTDIFKEVLTEDYEIADYTKLKNITI